MLLNAPVINDLYARYRGEYLPERGFTRYRNQFLSSAGRSGRGVH
jgi:hypothetical protein